MAVNDVVNDLVSILTSETATFQPAAGVEIMITYLGAANATAAQTFGGMTDGTINMRGTGLTTVAEESNAKMFINNTNYLYFQNDNAGTIIFAYTGVQTK